MAAADGRADEREREVGKSHRMDSPHPAARSGRKTTVITEEAFRGGSRLVKAGLISPSRKGFNHLSSTKGGVESAGGWAIRPVGRAALPSSPPPHPTSAVGVGVRAGRLTG